MATQTAAKANKANKKADPRQSADQQPTEDAKATGTGRRALLAKQEPTGEMLARGTPATSADKDMVTVVIPKAFKLACDDGEQITYEVGIQDMPRKHATHWFSKAQGVKIKG